MTEEAIDEVSTGIQFAFIADLDYSSEMSLLVNDRVWLAELFLMTIKVSVRTSQATVFFLLHPNTVKVTHANSQDTKPLERVLQTIREG